MSVCFKCLARRERERAALGFGSWEMDEKGWVIIAIRERAYRIRGLFCLGRYNVYAAAAVVGGDCTAAAAANRGRCRGCCCFFIIIFHFVHILPICKCQAFYRAQKNNIYKHTYIGSRHQCVYAGDIRTL